MKVFKVVIIFLGFLASCAIEQGNQNSSYVDDFEKSSSTGRQYKYSALDVQDYFFDFDPLDKLKPDQWSSLDWKAVDSQFRPLIEKYKAIGGYSLCIQSLVCDFLDRTLLKTLNSPQKSEAIAYYLEVLIEEKNPYWPLLTEALLSIKDSLDEATFNKTKSYIINDATKYLNQYGSSAGARLQPEVDKEIQTFIQERIVEAEYSLMKLK